MKIKIINGPNLNLLGTRNPEMYGHRTFDDVLSDLSSQHTDVQLDYFQSNIEGELIDCLQQTVNKYDGVLINAGGYSHTSVAIRDAIEAIQTPVLEIHMTNIAAREPFRHTSLLTAVCIGIVSGMGEDSYNLGLLALKNHLTKAR